MMKSAKLLNRLRLSMFGLIVAVALFGRGDNHVSVYDYVQAQVVPSESKPNALHWYAVGVAMTCLTGECHFF